MVNCLPSALLKIEWLEGKGVGSLKCHHIVCTLNKLISIEVKEIALVK